MHIFFKLTPALTALSLFNLTYLMFSKSFLCWKVLANPKYFCPWKYFVGAGIGGSLSFYCKMNGCAKKCYKKCNYLKHKIGDVFITLAICNYLKNTHLFLTHWNELCFVILFLSEKNFSGFSGGLVVQLSKITKQ